MSNRFSYVRYDEIRAKKQQAAKALVEQLEAFIVDFGPGRYTSLALTALEEAYMWMGKSIRDEQIAVDGGVQEEPTRGEELVNVAPKVPEGTVWSSGSERENFLRIIDDLSKERSMRCLCKPVEAAPRCIFCQARIALGEQPVLVERTPEVTG